MKYELLKGSNKGVLIDRTSILQDMQETYRISFLLPDNGSYIALFMDANGVEYRKKIENGVCKCPHELFGKREQYAGLIVNKIEDERITESYECESVHITAHSYMRKTQWQLSGGMTDQDAFNRLVELERRYSEVLTDVKALNESNKKFLTDVTFKLKEFDKKIKEFIKQEDII